ncbi:MAG: PilZ domain-containing protein [Candidatus Omnitrophota bacterium]
MNAWDGMNRRKFPRANYPCLVIIRHSHAGPEALLTHTENIGIGGVCVILKRNLKLFMPVELEIDLLDTTTHIKCEGKVVWSVKRSSAEEKKPSFYDTGIEFGDIPEVDEERVQDVVDRLMKQEKKSDQD